MRNHEMQNAKFKMQTVFDALRVFAFCMLHLALISSRLSAQDLERVTFDDAVRRAVSNHPTVKQAAASVLRAQAVLQQVRSRSRPSADAAFSTNVVEPVTSFG